MAYTAKTWVTGEVIQAVDLNHAENGIAEADAKATAISANGAIGTANLADGAVTLAKLADAVKEHFALADDLSKLKSDYDEIAESVKSRNLFNGNATNGYIAANGTISQSTTYKYSDRIDVSDYTGKTLYFGSNGSPSSVRFLCAYDASGNAVESAGSNSVISSYTVPNGILHIVVSFAVTPSSFSVEPEYLSSVYTGYYDYHQIKRYPPIDGAINIPQPTILKAATFASGQSLSFSGYNSVKRGNQVFSFYCKVPNGLDDNGYIVIGKDSTAGYAFGVSNTKWNYFINGNPLGSGAAHGLTIKDYLYFRVQIKEDGIAYITIKTNGGTYSRTNTSWSGEHGTPYCYNGCSTSVTDAVFTYTCEDYRHRLWIFGDSYTSIANNRWTYYLYEWGYNENILINGFPGEQSRMGFFDWRDALNHGTPSIAIWAYGMNNTDNGSINADWLTYTRLFLKDCEDRDITPILATIPCIPNGDNSYKNAWIRASGYRYIEFANAVNTEQDASTWFTGMLSIDNVHPDVQGAVALACKAIQDVPEIMIN